MYHEGESQHTSPFLPAALFELWDGAADDCSGEGHFDDGSAKPSGTATPIPTAEPGPAAKGKRKGISKKAKTLKQRLAIADGQTDAGAGAM